jgi:hypothetical protein
MKNDLTKIAGILRRKKFELKKEERKKFQDGQRWRKGGKERR